MNADSKYVALKNKYIELISSKEEEIRKLKEKLAVLDELMGEITESDKPKAQSVVTPQNGTVKNYSGYALTSAVLDALNTIGKEGVTVPALRDFMVSRGLTSGSQNLSNTITTALTRQVKHGKARTDRVGGKRFYFPA